MKKNIFFVLSVMIFSIINLNADLSNFKIRTFKNIKSGKILDEIVVPGVPPEKRISGPIAYPTRSSVILQNVPAFNWSFGCSATSAAMMSGYYDNEGYPANYKGQTNSGIMPQDNSSWPDWNDGYDNRHQCPLSATHKNLDGRTTDGHVDRFWKRYGKSSADGAEYADSFTDNPDSTYELCTADFMGTNQDWWNNCDGSTTFYYNDDGSPTENYTGSEESTPKRRDGIRGLRLFFESRGYTVTDNFNQYIEEEGKTYGFKFSDFENEINSGNPVLIQVEGHTMLGYGYDNADSTIYIHDTWDYNAHTMHWGGSYSGMHHYGVSVIHLEPKQTTSAPVFSPTGGTYTTSQNVELSLNSQPTSGTTTIRYTTNGNEPTEFDYLYSNPINIPLNTTETVRAKAFNTLWNPSETSSENYKITGKVDTPTISPESGTYYSTINCTIECSNPGDADIYYTIDGSDPVVGNAGTNLYTNSFQINSDTVVKAIGVKTDWTDSEIESKNYIVESAAPNLISPSNNASSVSYDSNLEWNIPDDGATPDGYKVAISTTNPPANYIDVGNVLSWQPSPHIDWNKTYFWKVMAYTNDKGNGQESSVYSFTVSDGDTAEGNGSNGGSGSISVNIDPIKIDETPVNPDVEIDSGNDLSVDIVVDDTPQNPGLSNPEDVSLSFRLDINGSGTLNFVLYFSGLADAGIQPNKLMRYDGSNWAEIVSPNWDYANEKVSFNLDIERGRASNEIVLNKGDATLPVELSSFTAIQTSSNLVQINWVTESETDFLGFNLFRSQTDDSQTAVKLNSIIISPTNTSNHNEYSFIDEEIENNTTYFYWLEEVDNSGISVLSNSIRIDVLFGDHENDTPENIAVYGITRLYPNPFNPVITVSYYLPRSSKVVFDIFNIRGEKIFTIDEGFKLQDKEYSISWNGSTFSGRISSGVYFIRLSTKNFSETKKILLMK